LVFSSTGKGKGFAAAGTLKSVSAYFTTAVRVIDPFIQIVLFTG